MKNIKVIVFFFTLWSLANLALARDIDAETKQILQKLTDYYNKNAPIQIDKYTLLLSANVYGNKTLSMNFSIDSGKDLNIFDPVIKQALHDMIVNTTCTTPDKLKFMRLLGVKYSHNYYTLRGIFVTKVEVTYDTCKNLSDR